MSVLLENSPYNNMFSGLAKLDGSRPAQGWRGADAASVPGSGATSYDPSCFYNIKYSDQTLSAALKYAYSGNALPGITWPSDISMMKWAKAVMCYYNRDVPQRKDGNKWADRSDLYFFDAAVRYFKKFNYQYHYANADCYQLKESLAGIDNERTNIAQIRLANGMGPGEEAVYLNLLKDLQSNIESVMAGLACTEYISNSEQQQASDSLLNQLQGASTITGKTDNTATYLTIGVVVLIAGVAIYMMVKK